MIHIYCAMLSLINKCALFIDCQSAATSRQKIMGLPKTARALPSWVTVRAVVKVLMVVLVATALIGIMGDD